MRKGFTHESTYNESKEWYTPEYIFDALALSFDLDPCSPGADIVCWIPAFRHYTIKENGLLSPWFGRVFMNPPYGSDTPKWFRKLALHGNGIGLVFCRSDTAWFHEYIPMADAICFIKGRVQFVPAEKDGINYPKLYYSGKYKPNSGCGAASMLVAFGKENAKALFNCGLGFTLPVIKPVVDGRNGKRFVGALAIPSVDNENPPRNAESGQLF
jgi:hypothetical protein